MGRNDAFEPTLLGASLRYWWIVLPVTALFTIGSYLIATSGEDTYSATVTIVVEDPGGEVLFDPEVVRRPERYIETQVAIIDSVPAAERAIELAAAAGHDVELTPTEMLENTTIAWRGASDVIRVAVTDEDAATATILANSLASAYEEIRQSQAGEELRSALVVLDESIAQLDEQTKSIEADLAEQRRSSSQLESLDSQYEEALNRLVEIQVFTFSPDAGALEDLRAAFADLRALFDNLGVVLDLEERRPEVASLLSERDLAEDRRSLLVTRRDQLEVDLGLARSGVVLMSPAEDAELVPRGWLPTTTGALLLGAVLGAAIAFSLAVRRRRFTSSTQPEEILVAPLLAGVPSFKGEGLPVRDDMVSRSAEAFRFAVSALESRIAAIATPAEKTGEGVRSGRSIAVISALPGDGKTVVTANLAVAMAQNGLNVLAIDGDFGAQQLMELLDVRDVFSTRERGGGGLADVIAGDVALADAVRRIPLADGRHLDVLGIGLDGTASAEILTQTKRTNWLTVLAESYDYVVVDTPPILYAAYGGSLASQADHVVVVVPHGSMVSNLEELQDRLFVVRDSGADGYVYNRDPRRRTTTRYTASVPFVPPRRRLRNDWATGEGPLRAAKELLRSGRGRRRE